MTHFFQITVLSINITEIPVKIKILKKISYFINLRGRVWLFLLLKNRKIVIRNIVRRHRQGDSRSKSTTSSFIHKIILLIILNYTCIFNSNVILIVNLNLIFIIKSNFVPNFLVEIIDSQSYIKFKSIYIYFFNYKYLLTFKHYWKIIF